MAHVLSNKTAHSFLSRFYFIDLLLQTFSRWSAQFLKMLFSFFTVHASPLGVCHS